MFNRLHAIGPKATSAEAKEKATRTAIGVARTYDWKGVGRGWQATNHMQ